MCIAGPIAYNCPKLNVNILGDLNFDCSQQKWGLGWRERLACTDCDFVSVYHKLYDEIDTLKPGRKAAKMNVTAAVGLMYMPISNKNFREILMVSNIIPFAHPVCKRPQTKCQIGLKI